MKLFFYSLPLFFVASCVAQTAPQAAAPQTPAPQAAAPQTAALQSAPPQTAARQAEKLGRGVVALVEDGKVWVSWRLLPGEETHAFDLFRKNGKTTEKLNAAPLASATNFWDETADLTEENRYFVRVAGENTNGAGFVLPAQTPSRPYLSIPLQTPAGYAPNDASAADLDGDGEYDLVLHQSGRAKDNSHGGETDPPILQGIKLDGTLLWTINLGRNIREGAHYTQFMVYDLDGDGRAEVVCKTADGTTDGTGKVIGDPDANYVNQDGRILSGPEFLTAFDGLTGAALATTAYLPARLPDEPKNLAPTGDQLKWVWGDGYGNRGDRFLAAIAYLDGQKPSVVMARGYYTRTVLAAWDFRDGKLSSRWIFDSDKNEGWKFGGQGNHSLSVGDVNGDGRDDIVYGKMTVGGDGQGLYSTGIGHGDAGHLSDLDPDRPGLEVFGIQEPFGDAGAHLFDAATGEILWKKASVSKGKDGEGPGRGLALDIDPRYPGFETWVAGAGLGGQLWDIKGNKIADRTPSVNMGVYWDGDFLREVLDGTWISKWDWENAVANPILKAEEFDAVANNGTKANPVLCADLFGDWREEVTFRTKDNSELRIFTSTLPTTHRLPTLMSDPIYRMSIAWQNVGYNQPAHLGYALDISKP